LCAPVVSGLRDAVSRARPYVAGPTHLEMDVEMPIEVPLHLTGFFYPIYTSDPHTTGSIGAGVVITPGLVCNIRIDQRGITFNGEALKAGPAVELYGRLKHPLGIELQGDCAPGAGYAFSAASALAVGSALVASGMATPLEVARMAHVVEVEHGTGLGDVLAIWEGGGLTVRTVAGAPGVGRAASVRVEENVVVLTTELGTMSTRQYLSEHLDKIRSLGRRLYERFIADPSLSLFLELSESFSRDLGLADEKILDVVRRLSPRILGWYVKKRVLVVVAEQEWAADVAKTIEESINKARWFRLGGAGWRKSLETIRDTSR